MVAHPQEWLKVTPEGLYCRPGDFYIDPVAPVARACITHGHSDHARANHAQVFATAPTLAIMHSRYGEAMAQGEQAVVYGEAMRLGHAQVTFFPARHILGSAQILIEHEGWRVIISGDYKRRRDPTCAPFEVQPCDIFITEATFGLPVFHHPSDDSQIAKLLQSLALNPERTHLVGAYPLGKCQRVICLLREAGYKETIYLHGAMIALCDLYRAQGVELGALAPVADRSKEEMQGKIVLAPPSALHERWSRRLADPVTAFASGWMMIRARARQKRVDLPLVISDHADWDELTRVIHEVGASEVWVTHGREDALVYYANKQGLKARPLDLAGYDEEEDD